MRTDRKLTRALGSVVIGGVAMLGMTLGTAGLASAQTAPSDPAPSQGSDVGVQACERAEARLPALGERQTRTQQLIDRLNAAIAAAQANHNDERVQRLQHRLEYVQRRHDHVVDVIGRIHARCG